MDKQEPIKPDTRITANSPAPSTDEAKPEDALAEGELDAGSWLRQNRMMLVLAAILVAYLYYQFNLDGLLAIGKVALGLSLVIFVHELGHYLAAKWCGVYVQVFSIGFGPAVPGCHFKRGETYYKLAIFPFGGYVQMLGQVDGQEESDGSEEDPRSYRNKTVLQRMLIISAGVIMNAILAVICFVIVFQGPGKERRASVVSVVDSGSPSFTVGIPSGAVIKQIGEIENPNFKDLTVAVISHYNSELKVVFQRPEDKEATTVYMIPRKDSNDDRPLMGVSPSFNPVLEEKRFIGTELATPTIPNSAASKAKPAFAFSDEIIATTDPTDPAKITALPKDPRKAEGDQLDYFELSRRMQLLAGKEMIFVVKRDGQAEPVKITVPPEFHNILGAVMAMGEVTAIRKGSPADTAGLQKPRLAADGKTTLEGDYIQWVEVQEPDKDKTIVRYTADLGKAPAVKDAKIKEILLDPLRLPDQLRDWAKRMKKAGVSPQDWQVKLHVKFQKPPPPAGGNNQFDFKTLDLTWDKNWEFDRAEPYSKDSPQSIPELGLGFQVKTMIVDVAEPAGGDESLRPGDAITAIKFHSIADDKGTVREGDWQALNHNQWAHAFWIMQSPNLAKVSLKVNRGKKEDGDLFLTVTPRKAEDWPVVQRGLILAQDKRLQKAHDFFDAVSLGLRDTYNTITDLLIGLKSLFTRAVKPEKSLGGPVMIATLAYQYASIDLWEFIFFIGMISINLAVINFLPIPVLDGGHMVFLIYELIRGKPASERIRAGATYAGLLFIAGLFLFVLYLDISRLFFRPG